MHTGKECNKTLTFLPHYTHAETETDGLSYHRQPAPSVSDRKMNPVTGKGSLVQSRTAIILTKTHGILMVVAWPVLAVTGAYFSAFMKPALPNGAWFQVGCINSMKTH